jgi:membrane protein YqaA with SNARE-associated domain
MLLDAMLAKADSLGGILLQRRSPPPLLRFFVHWGGLGLIPLAIADSSFIPTFGSLDVLTALLAARNANLWPYYASMSTLGSMIGAYLMYRLGRKTGRGWMERRFGARRSNQVEYALERWGFGAVFVSTVAPPPCPTSLFLLAAGAFDYKLKRFLLAVFTGRAIRYSLITMVAAIYGRTIVRYFRHPGKYLIPSLLVTFAIVALTALYLYFMTRKVPQLASRRQLDSV